MQYAFTYPNRSCANFYYQNLPSGNTSDGLGMYNFTFKTALQTFWPLNAMHWPAARFVSWLWKRYNGAFNRPKIPPSQWLRSCVVWPGMEDSVEPFKYTRTAPQTLMCILHCSWGEFNAVIFWEWHPSSLLDAASYLPPLHPSEHILMPENIWFTELRQSSVNHTF